MAAQVATELNRILLGRDLHPLVVCTLVAHGIGGLDACYRRLNRKPTIVDLENRRKPVFQLQLAARLAIVLETSPWQAEPKIDLMRQRLTQRIDDKFDLYRRLSQAEPSSGLSLWCPYGALVSTQEQGWSALVLPARPKEGMATRRIG